MTENKMDKIESLLKWLVSGEKDEDGNWLSDDDTQLVCDALEYYLNMHGQKNKMAQVAVLFGKKLGEEFKLDVVKDNKFLPKRIIFTVKFTKAGLERLTKYNAWEQINCFIPYLLTGKAVVVND